MATPDQELIIILSNFSIPVSTRKQGWEYLLGLTGSEEGLEKICSYEKYGVLLGSYVKSSKSEPETKDLAYKCLLNISSSSKGTDFLLRSCKNLLASLLQEICKASEFTKIQCSILSNLSNYSDLLKIEGFAPLFVDTWNEQLGARFNSPNEVVRKDYSYLALLLSNLSGTSDGRKLLARRSFFKTFPNSLDPSELDVRRLGIALTLRNCCSETSLHGQILREFNILPALLQPLIEGGVFREEEKKKLPRECQTGKVWREKVPQVRKAIIQAIAMLCYTEEGWNYLKSHGVYPVCREFHILEVDPDVKEAIETLVGYMMVETYGDVHLDPSYSDQLQDIPDFLLSKAEELPVVEARSGEYVEAIRKANDTKWYTS